MRYTPAAVALSILAAVSSSVIHSQAGAPLDSRAVSLLAQGKSDLSGGQTEQAIGAFEAALTIAPGNPAVLIALADAERKQGLQGKSLHYYRMALKADPRNLAAIAGEGVALAEKGAVDKASLNLARLETLCGKSCSETKALSAAIARGPDKRVVSAEAVSSKPVVSEN